MKIQTVFFIFLILITKPIGLKNNEAYSISEFGDRQEKAVSDIHKIEPLGNKKLKIEAKATDEEVCLAQILYSESKNKTHWVYLGWSARNRVDLIFRGHTYCKVANWPSQFSAISLKSDPGHTKIKTIHRSYLKGILSSTDTKLWESAIQVGRIIINADSALNPVPDAVYFWYIPAYESGNINWPSWAKGKVAPYVLRKPNSKDISWAFYRQIDIA